MSVYNDMDFARYAVNNVSLELNLCWHLACKYTDLNKARDFNISHHAWIVKEPTQKPVARTRYEVVGWRVDRICARPRSTYGQVSWGFVTQSLPLGHTCGNAMFSIKCGKYNNVSNTHCARDDNLISHCDIHFSFNAIVKSTFIFIITSSGL